MCAAPASGSGHAASRPGPARPNAPLTVLVTGGAGRVADVIRPHLRRRFALRLLDLVPIDDLVAGEEAAQGDLNDPAFLTSALQGAHGVVHLACVHGYGADFERTLDANYRATLALLDAAVRERIDRVVYTSSHHVQGMHRREGFAGDDAPLAPDGFYGLSKAFGEAACALYARRFGLRTLVIRVGNADRTVGDERRLRIWTSGHDLAELIAIGLTHPEVRHEVVYGVSRCDAPLFANARASRLGYAPRDRAEDHLGPDFVPYERMADADGRDHVGGPYAAAPLPPPGRPS
jgi:uronate dehydrogenase